MKNYFFLLCTFIVGIVFGLLTRCEEQDVGVTDVVRTDTIVKFDTICIAEPVATDSVVIRYVTRWLAVAEKPDTDLSGTVAEKTDTDVSGTVAEKTDTDVSGTVAIGVDALVNDVVANDMPPDSVRVIVPITQKTYETDEYKAWVSGYEPELDSINIYRRTETVTNTICLDKNRRRWGVMTGIGAGISHKGNVTPMVGVMIGYKFF